MSLNTRGRCSLGHLLEVCDDPTACWAVADSMERRCSEGKACRYPACRCDPGWPGGGDLGAPGTGSRID